MNKRIGLEASLKKLFTFRSVLAVPIAILSLVWLMSTTDLAAGDVNRYSHTEGDTSRNDVHIEQKLVFLPLTLVSPSWRRISQAGQRTRDVTSSSDDPEYIIVATENSGLIRGSACVEGNWVTQGLDDHFTLSVLSTDGVLLTGTFGAGLWRRDENSNWVRVQDVTNPYVWTLAANPSVAHVYAGTDGGVFQSDEVGENWVHWSDGLIGDALLINNLEVDASGDVWAATYGEGVWLSGATNPIWVRRNNGLPSSALWAWDLVRTGPDQLTLGTSDGVFRQDANGVWHRLGPQLGETVVYALALDEEDGSVFAGTRSSGVYWRPPASDQWKPFTAGLPSGAEIRSLLVVSECSVLVAATSDGVWSRALPRNPAE